MGILGLYKGGKNFIFPRWTCNKKIILDKLNNDINYIGNS